MSTKNAQAEGPEKKKKCCEGRLKMQRKWGQKNIVQESTEMHCRRRETYVQKRQTKAEEMFTTEESCAGGHREQRNIQEEDRGIQCTLAVEFVKDRE
jgi:hypothetical protein